MPDLLTNVGKINQPVNTGYDNNSVRNNPILPGDTQIRNVVDPSKIVRPDGKPETEDKQFAFSSESNYGNFIQNLRDMPKLAELFSKFIFTDMQMMITSGLSENFASQIAEFMEMLKMDPEQLTGFMKEQVQDSGKFSGVFFQALKDILNHSSSIELRTGILEFLKHYSDMSSSEHLLRNILAEMGEMKPYMFKEDAEQLEVLKNMLKTELPRDGGTRLSDAMDQNILENSRILKEEIIPFFSKYITRTKDLGHIRDIMTLVVLNAARYGNGTKESVISSFEKLLQFADFRKRLGEIKEDSMEIILDRVLREQKDGESKPWTERLLSMMKSGLNGEGGYETRAVFQNLLNAMLLNESVYMPLVHLMLPLNIGGNLMFSEMWVDPDANNGSYSSDGDEERNIRMLIKFDIKDLGFFDLVLNYRKGNVDMMISYPPKLSFMEKTIRNGLSQIVAENGLSFQSLTMEKGFQPVQIMDVFPKIAEGRNAVNVRV